MVSVSPVRTNSASLDGVATPSVFCGSGIALTMYIFWAPMRMVISRFRRIDDRAEYLSVAGIHIDAHQSSL